MYVPGFLLWPRPVSRDLGRSGGGRTGGVRRELYEGIVPALSHAIVLLKEYEYFRWENGQVVRVVPHEADESGEQD